MTFYTENPPYIDIQIWVNPGSRHEGLRPARELGLVISVHAHPQDGKANEAVRSVLAKFLKISKSQVTLLKGKKSRQKYLRIPFKSEFLDELNKL